MGGQRILELGATFAVGVYAYAVMGNHLHVVLHVNPAAVRSWSGAEVAARWTRLFPVVRDGAVDAAETALRADGIARDAGRVSRYRARLADVSWFMRRLSEPIARRANREDGCSGRFWEGRFKAQALLDDAAVLACMVYVDLNPVRAAIAADVADSIGTSARRRLAALETESGTALLGPICAGFAAPALPLRPEDYLALVDWTGRQARPGKRGRIDADRPAVLQRIGQGEQEWCAQVLGIETRYFRAVGAVDALVAKAGAIGQRWLKGAGTRRGP